jgi:hypothetical protein
MKRSSTPLAWSLPAWSASCSQVWAYLGARGVAKVWRHTPQANQFTRYTLSRQAILLLGE